MMARYTAAAALGIALVMGACSGDGATAETSPTPVETTAVAVDTTTSTVATPSPSTTVTTPEPVSMGEWVETVFGEDRFILDLALASDGDLLALLHERSGRFRILELGDRGGWGAQTDWVVPSTAGFDHVSWLSLTVFEGFYVVVGYGQLPTSGAEVTHVPAFATIDIATGETTTVLDRDNPNNGIVVDVTVVDGRLVAVGEAPNVGNDWGPGIWTSDDGATWQREETPEQVAGVIIQLNSVVEWDGVAVSVGQNNWDTDPPYALRSTNGMDWQAAILPGVAALERVRLSGVVHDGSEFVIVGESDSDGESVWRSSDGLSWTRDETQPAVFGDGEVNTDGVWGGNGAVLVSGEGMHRESFLYCVDDPSTCRQSFTALWLRTGGAWQRLVSPYDSWTYTVAMVNQRVVTTGRVDDAGAVWVWIPAADDLLPVASPFDLSPPVADIPELGPDPVIEEGASYLVPLSEDCYGMSYLGFINGVHWLIDGEPVMFSADWPVMIGPGQVGDARTVFGTIELVSPERIEYTVDGFGVVATYVPAPDDYEPYGCF